eukprot:ANDGO_05569.mRNA.1 Translation machinery-associated protein 20
MFKKGFRVSTQTVLGGKDRKLVRKRLLDAFPRLDQSSFDRMFSTSASGSADSAAESVVVQYRCSDLRLTVFGTHAVPLFFSLEAAVPGQKDAVLPTIYALMSFPNLMDCNVYVPSQVSQFVLNGADLMLPGVDTSLTAATFSKDEVAAIYVAGNPVPFAVGKMLVSGEEAVKSNWRGRGVEVMHSFGDALWNMLGAGGGPARIFPKGFTSSRVYPIEDVHELPHANSETEYLSSAVADLAVASAGHDDGRKINGHAADEILSDSVSTEPPAEKEAMEPARKEPEGISREKMDADILACFYSALMATVSSTDLPVELSEFFSARVLPFEQEGMDLDLKASSWKKLSKLAQHLKKLGVLSTKEKQDQLYITAIDNRHASLRDFIPLKTNSRKKQKRDGDNDDEEEEEEDMAIMEVYQVPAAAAFLFPNSRRLKDEYFSMREIQTALKSYTQPLESAEDKSSVKVDENILDAFFRQTKAHPQIGSLVSKRELFGKYLPSVLKPFTLIRLPGTPAGQEPRIIKGSLKPVEIIVERRQGSKWVSRILHLEQFGISLDEFGSACQKKFAASASVDGNEVNLQGRPDRLKEFVCAELGLSQNHVIICKK